MSELAPIHPSPAVPVVKKVGKRRNQNKREKQAEEDAVPVEQAAADDQPVQHIDEIV